MKMKKIYFTLDDNDYLTGYWESPSNIEGEIELDIEDDHDFFTSDFSCWKYENGELVFDEERQEQLIEKHKREENKPSQLDMLALAVMELTEIVLGKEDK